MVVLLELERSLLSRKDMTPQEAYVFETCKSRGVRAFTGSAIMAGSIAMAVTGRLSTYYRAIMSGGVGVFVGLWRFGRSLDSSVENMLAQDETRLQIELANLIVQKYHNDPHSMQLLDKHFYTEKLFKDSEADRLILKWRYRNFYSDGSLGQDSPLHEHEHEHRHQSKSPGEPQNESSNGASSQSHNVGHYNPTVRMTDSGTKQVSILVSPELDLMADPLDCIFGDTVTVEINSPNTSKTQPRTHSRAHKRSHRRSRMRHQEST